MAFQIQRITQHSIRIRFFGNQTISMEEARRLLFYRGDGSDGGPRQAITVIRNPIVQTGRNEFTINVMRIRSDFIREEYRRFFNAAVNDRRPMQTLPAGQAWLQRQINRSDIQWRSVGSSSPTVQVTNVGNRVIWRQGNRAQFYRVMPASQGQYIQHGVNPTAARAMAASAAEYNSFMHQRVIINGCQPSAAMFEFQRATTDRLRAGLITFIVSAGAGHFGAYPSNLFSTAEQNRILGLVNQAGQ